MAYAGRCGVVPSWLPTIYTTEVREKPIDLKEFLNKVNKRAAKSSDFSPAPKWLYEDFACAVLNALRDSTQAVGRLRPTDT